MKETNMEHFRSEIEKILDKGTVIAVSKDGRRVFECNAYGICEECLCGDIGKLPCDVTLMRWLMSEYKEEPVLTQREKGFVECIKEGWIARDSEGTMEWYEEKPLKRFGCWLYTDEQSAIYLNREMFSFITWEDEEPWSVEELRKLKSLEYNPEDVAFKKGGSDENSSV